MVQNTQMGDDFTTSAGTHMHKAKISINSIADNATYRFDLLSEGGMASWRDEVRFDNKLTKFGTVNNYELGNKISSNNNGTMYIASMDGNNQCLIARYPSDNFDSPTYWTITGTGPNFGSDVAMNGSGSTVDVVCTLSTMLSSFLDNQIRSLSLPLSAFSQSFFLKLALPMFLFLTCLLFK